MSFKTPRYKNYDSGTVMGELTYLGDSPHVGDMRRGVFVCRCGKIITSAIKYAKIKDVKSCGCHRIEVWTKNLPNENKNNHGKANTEEYIIWKGMKARCYNRNNPSFDNYGGRGIVMSPEWKGDFRNFLKDMGLRPSKNMSIDRIDCNGNYSKENCRWATTEEQSRNTRQNIWLTYKGETKLQTDWAKERGINKSALCRRLKRGWSVELAITTPAYFGNRFKNLQKTI